MPLTPKQRRFCEQFMLLPTKKEAVIAAGYSGKHPTVTAAKLWKNPEVQEYIAKLEAEAAERNNINQDELIERLRENYASAKEAKQYNACNRAIELEAKMGGLLKDQVHVTSLEARSDEDLIKDIAGDDPIVAAALRKRFGAPETFDTPGQASNQTAEGGNPHNGTMEAGEGGAGQR